MAHHIFLLPAYIGLAAILVATVTNAIVELRLKRRYEWRWYQRRLQDWLHSRRQRRYYR